MQSITKGNATEAAVIKALVGRDFPVLIPFGEGQPYDLVVDLTVAWLKIQCKTARAVRDVLEFNSCSTDHGNGRGSYLGLADAFGVYFPSADAVFMVPVLGAPSSKAYLRLKPARNNQRRRIRLAADYEIGRWTREALVGLSDTSAQHPPALHPVPS